MHPSEVRQHSARREGSLAVRTARLPFWPLPTIGVRRLRLASGLVLFAYVGSHLLNTALGNLSVAAMEAGLQVQEWIWQSVPGTTALYAALAIHFALGIWGAYERRHFGWTKAEIAQVLLGLTIPFLLMNHLFVTRMALTQFEIRKGYVQELYSFWVAAPRLGVLQVSVLIVAWLHGCIGLFLWLRLRPLFQRMAAYLLCGAVMLPVLALLGFFQGGRTIMGLADDPAWRAANLAPGQAGTPATNATLLIERDACLLAALCVVALVVLARGWRAWRERRGGTVRVTYPGGRQTRVPLGFSILEASRAARIPHASICGGRARCSTCRVRIVSGTGRIPPAGAEEQTVLDRHGAGPLVRLACQLRPEGDISVVPLLPPNWTAAQSRTREWPKPGEERFIVVLVVDMRDSTQMAVTRLPFDAVFIIDRFVTAVGSAVAEAGGRANHFTGDGLMATFGLACEPAEACRQAIHAISLIGRNVAALNQILVAETSEPIRFGIGVHGSNAVVGEIGYAESRVFTTLGDAANVATRLESLCKPFACEAVISDDVCKICGYDLSALPRHLTTVRGREEALPVRIIAIIGEEKLLGLGTGLTPGREAMVPD
jgi:adenylate cyclase